MAVTMNHDHGHDGLEDFFNERVFRDDREQERMVAVSHERDLPTV
jgi:hypothetical protein